MHRRQQIFPRRNIIHFQYASALLINHKYLAAVVNHYQTVFYGIHQRVKFVRLHPVILFKLIHHLVEYSRELPYFIIAFNFDPDAEIPVCHSGCAFAQFHNRPRYTFCQSKRYPESNQTYDKYLHIGLFYKLPAGCLNLIFYHRHLRVRSCFCLPDHHAPPEKPDGTYGTYHGYVFNAVKIPLTQRRTRRQEFAYQRNK